MHRGLCSPCVRSETPAWHPCPKGCHKAPSASRSHRDGEAQRALRQEGNASSCAGAKIATRSSRCQLGRTPESAQVPLQPFFSELTRCLRRHPTSAADVVRPGTLGQSGSIPAVPSPRSEPGKHLAWTFLKGHFQASSHTFLCELMPEDHGQALPAMTRLPSQPRKRRGSALRSAHRWGGREVCGGMGRR